MPLLSKLSLVNKHLDLVNIFSLPKKSVTLCDMIYDNLQPEGMRRTVLEVLVPGRSSSISLSLLVSTGLLHHDIIAILSVHKECSIADLPHRLKCYGSSYYRHFINEKMFRRGAASPTSPKARRHRELILSPLAAYHSQMAGRQQGIDVDMVIHGSD